MTIKVELNKILSNPWQTRLGEASAEYIEGLALDIAKNGLMQAPAGRVIDRIGKPVDLMGDIKQVDFDVKAEYGYRVELAFGHNRLAAFKWLAEQNLTPNPFPAGKGDWSRMPVELKNLSDQQMADMAWSENEKRRDVTPIERARAIERRMGDFSWSQAEAAEHLGINRSTVSNILRLLKLPEKLQTALGAGTISERAAMALLPMYDLPEETLKTAEGDWGYRPSGIVGEALAGASSDKIRQQVDNLFERNTKQLIKAEFGLDEMFSENTPVGGYDHDASSQVRVYCGVCRTCDRRLKDRGNICLDQACYIAKTTLHRRAYLAKAAEACGIPAVDPNKGGNVTALPYSDERARKIIGTRCENLRLVYNWVGKDDVKSVPGYPYAHIICDKRNNSCSCAKGLELASVARVEEKAFENDDEYEGPEEDDDEDDEEVCAQTLPTPNPSLKGGEGNEAVLSSARELEEIARRARQAKKDVPAAWKELQARLVNLAVEWLRNDEPGAFYALVQGSTYMYHSKDLENIYRAGANKIACLLVSQPDYSSVEEMYQVVNRRLEGMGLPTIGRGKTMLEMEREVVSE